MKDPAFLFYSSDFLTGVTDLTMEERGQFITMLCIQHQKGHLSEKTIRLSVGLVSVDVRNKFALDKDGNLFNEVLDKHIENRKNFIESRRNNGIKGGRPKKEGKALGLPSANLPENENENENVNVNVIKNKKKIFDFSFVELDYKETFEKWINYKKEKKQMYKTQESLEDCYNNLLELSENNPQKAMRIVFQSTGNNWSGLFKLKNEDKQTKKDDARNYIASRIVEATRSGN
jgi:hypothetical protein